MKTLTLNQKRKIAKLAVEKSQTIENGTLSVFKNGNDFEILDNFEYRDDIHRFVCSLQVWNESKPYSQAAFIRQINQLDI